MKKYAKLAMCALSATLVMSSCGDPVEDPNNQNNNNNNTDTTTVVIKTDARDRWVGNYIYARGGALSFMFTGVAGVDAAYEQILLDKDPGTLEIKKGQDEKEVIIAMDDDTFTALIENDELVLKEGYEKVVQYKTYTLTIRPNLRPAVLDDETGIFSLTGALYGTVVNAKGQEELIQGAGSLTATKK